MSKNSSKRNKMAGRNNTRRIEEIFQALPPLGSDDYIQRISSAKQEEIPPEVLARALRQLPPTSAAYDATLRRLLKRTDGVWEYFGPLTAKARRMRVGTHDYEDVLADAFDRIVQTLPTARGELAERAWHSFCHREAIEAWRKRFGRRGEHLPKEEAVGSGEPAKGGETDGRVEDVFEVDVLPPWHVKRGTDNTERIEQIARTVVDQMPDGFIREVAERAWFENMRPKISGKPKGEALSLTDVFDGKSRHQIQRALRHADAQLAAALLADEEIDWSSEQQAFFNQRIGVRSSAVRKEESR